MLRDAAARQNGTALDSLFPWEVLCFKLTYSSSREDKVMRPSASVAPLPVLVNKSRATAAVGCLRADTWFS